MVIIPSSRPGLTQIPIKRLVLSLALLQFVLAFPFAAYVPIGSSSEAREIHVAQEVLRQNEWVLPLRNGIVPSKPPLFHWIVAGLGAAVGDVHPIVGRAVSLAFACGVLVLTLLLCSQRVERESLKQSSVLIAALVLGSTYGYASMLWDLRVDMTFSFFTTLAIYSILMPLYRSMPRPVNFYQFATACGLATLAKGPLGLILPCLVVGACFVSREGFVRGLARFLSAWPWIVIYLLIVVPWYLAAYKYGGALFLSRVLFENVERFQGGPSVNAGPIWFYVVSLARTAFPWSWLAAYVGIVLLFRRGEWQRLPQPARDGLLWVVMGLILFSASAGKRHSYVLPLFPGLALFASAFVLNWWERIPDYLRERVRTVWRGLNFTALYFLFTLLMAVVLVTEWPALRSVVEFAIQEFIEKSKTAVWAGIILGLGLWLSLVVRVSIKKEEVLLRSFAGLVLLFQVSVTTGLGIKNRIKNFESTAQRLEAYTGGAPITVVKPAWDELFDPVLYYLGRPVRVDSNMESPLICPGFVFTRTNYLKSAGLKNAFDSRSISIVTDFIQLADAHNDRNDRRMTLLRCNASVGPRQSLISAFDRSQAVDQIL